MATQTVTHHSPVVQFPQSVPATEISQQELVDLIEARNVLTQLEEKVESLESSIKARLEAGSAVQTGVHIAELKTSSRRNVAWKDVVMRLAERLKLNGEVYCARVLAATKPSISVSLDVK
jgi:hypothetical protein